MVETSAVATAAVAVDIAVAAVAGTIDI